MNLTFHRLTAIIALGTHLLLNCIVMPFHTHGISGGPEIIIGVQHGNDGTDHAGVRGHSDDCTICHTFRDITSAVPFSFAVHHEIVIENIGQTLTERRCSVVRSSASLRGPPVFHI